MVIVVGISTIPYLGPNTSLFLTFSMLVSLHNICQLVHAARTKGHVQPAQRPDNASATSNRILVGAKGQTLTLVLHGHAFTSPDAPINDPEDEIPQRFINGCEGDLKEARRRWDITKHWRETEVSTTEVIGFDHSN
jgi:hypothetical protein